jgi:thymidine phosphorylase
LSFNSGRCLEIFKEYIKSQGSDKNKLTKRFIYNFVLNYNTNGTIHDRDINAAINIAKYA